MKISIVTVVFNDLEGFRRTLASVVEQRKYYPNIEFVVIDGGSVDGTEQCIIENVSLLDYWVSEPDLGIYDAMNKGIRAATGEGLLFLNAGDYFVGDVLGGVSSIPCFLRVKYTDILGRFKNRRIVNKRLSISNCHQGIVFERKNIFYDTNYRIAADYKFFLDYGYDESIQVIPSDGYVLFDAVGGVSSRKIAERDLEIYNIRKDFFGFFVAFSYEMVPFLKRFIRKFLKQSGVKQ